MELLPSKTKSVVTPDGAEYVGKELDTKVSVTTLHQAN